MSPQMKNAKTALKNGSFNDAVEYYEEHLSLFPEDKEALLEYGIANFLAGDEEKFILLHEELAGEFDKTDNLDPRISKLWSIYKKFLNNLVKGAAIAGMAALPVLSSGCGNDTETKKAASHSNPVPAAMNSNSVRPNEKYGLKPPHKVTEKLSNDTTDKPADPKVKSKPAEPPEKAKAVPRPAASSSDGKVQHYNNKNKTENLIEKAETAKDKPKDMKPKDKPKDMKPRPRPKYKVRPPVRLRYGLRRPPRNP